MRSVTVVCAGATSDLYNMTSVDVRRQYESSTSEVKIMLLIFVWNVFYLNLESIAYKNAQSSRSTLTMSLDIYK